MPETFSVAGNKWDSLLSHFEDCAVINKWNDAHKPQFLAVCMRGALLLQLQFVARWAGRLHGFKNSTLLGKEWIELQNAEFRVRRREWDEKLLDLTSLLQ